jgi:hypothetical protein
MTQNKNIVPNRGNAQVGYAKYTTATTTAGTTQSETLTINGKIISMHIVAPDLATDTTYQVDLLNADGVVLWTKSGISDNSTTKFERGDTNMPYPVALADTCTLKYTWTTAQTGGSLDFVAHIYYE